MNESQIRQIVQDEIKRGSNASRFNLQAPQLHAHTGIDGSPQIRQENIIPSVSVSGRIEFAQATTYTINLNSSFTPSNILAYGVVVDDAASPTIRCQTIGSANLTPSFYLQPGDSTSVTTGTLQYPFKGEPLQSSSYISVQNGGTFHALASEGHIVSIEYGGTVHARATVTSFSKTAITINVPFLDAGWSIIVNYVIT